MKRIYNPVTGNYYPVKRRSKRNRKVKGLWGLKRVG